MIRMQPDGSVDAFADFMLPHLRWESRRRFKSRRDKTVREEKLSGLMDRTESSNNSAPTRPRPFSERNCYV